jgi:hypothetical protein
MPLIVDCCPAASDCKPQANRHIIISKITEKWNILKDSHEHLANRETCRKIIT